jgi:hypothetical protein
MAEHRRLDQSRDDSVEKEYQRQNSDGPRQPNGRSGLTVQFLRRSPFKANVSLPAVRATAFAVNIIHPLGDVQAFWLLWYIGGHTNMHVAFLFMSGIIFPLRRGLADRSKISSG